MRQATLRILIVLTLVSATAAAQGNYPARPVRLIVPVAPGGAADFAARFVGQRLGDAWGQPVIIDNRPGGAGNVGVDLTAKASPDGHTLVLPITSFPVNPSLYKALPFDTEKDLAAVVLVGSGALVLVVTPAVAANSVEQLIALAKAKPGSLNYANSGNGTTAHLAGELFKRMAGVNVVGVPYRGGGPAIVDLIAGHVQLYFSTLPAAMTQVKAGRLRALGVTSLKRVAEFPDIAAVHESGLAGFDVTYWVGFFMPAGSPAAAIRRVNADTHQVLKLAETREKFSAQGLAVGGGTPAELASLLKADIAKWAKVVKEAGIRSE
jgi:tripartite-type tricarboxylate transporter receptor subunit TctC